ncbi:MAG: transcriptional regulator [Rhodospirillales bacterium CG15_BIG_FIL_POST_REV_8_21_14_020_66_15]|nr:MAG: transcriptional regulator [Rhodospirillales bacterium CG15_BIG_FIL_POST_REV_8_21_14_020_66_15]
MDGNAFRHWRKRHKMSQKDAAKALGLKPRIIQYYEKGERDGKTVEIPLSVRLACYAIESGVGDFDGEDSTKFKFRAKKGKD